MRVTPSMMARSILGNITRGSTRIERLHEILASGKKVLRPSDDPAAARGILADRGRLDAVAAYKNSISSARAVMSVMEGALVTAEESLVRAREITLEGANGTADLAQRQALALELDSLRQSLLVAGNASVEGRYLFGGGRTTEAPYYLSQGRIAYRGDDGGREVAADVLDRVGVTVPGRSVFSVSPAELDGTFDLNPAVVTGTPLADLLRGHGVVLGQMRITDSDGAVGVVDFAGAVTVGDILARVNAAGTAVTASLTPAGDAIRLTDGGSGPSFTVEDWGGSIAASELGLAGTSDTGSMDGLDLDPKLAHWNTLAMLRGGAGIAPGILRISNGTTADRREATLDLTGAVTVGDLAEAIAAARDGEGRPLGVTLAFTDGGAGVALRSGRGGTTLTAGDVAGGGLGAALGIAGSSDSGDVFSLLQSLADTLRAGEGDPEGVLQRGLADLVTALDNVLSARAGIGVRLNRLERIESRLLDEELAIESDLDTLESTDLAQGITDLTLASQSYEAALGIGGRILGPSLFDYLR